MLGSNPSADSGSKTEEGVSPWHTVPYSTAESQDFCEKSKPRDWNQSDKSQGSGGWRQIYTHSKPGSAV
jgi:hypothetical protein